MKAKESKQQEAKIPINRRISVNSDVISKSMKEVPSTDPSPASPQAFVKVSTNQQEVS